jgi:hypothetical protein
MKLCRYGKNGYEKPGMIDSQGMLRDLSGVLSNIDQETISPKGLAKLRKIRPESLPLIKTEPRFGVPYTGITKFVASRVVGTPDGSPAPFYRVAELHFPSLEALQTAAASPSAQKAVAHAVLISTGGKPIFLVAEEDTKTF